MEYISNIRVNCKTYAEENMCCKCFNDIDYEETIINLKKNYWLMDYNKKVYHETTMTKPRRDTL